MHNGPEIVLVLQLQRNVKILLKAIVSKEKETHKGCKKHWQTAEIRILSLPSELEHQKYTRPALNILSLYWKVKKKTRHHDVGHNMKSSRKTRQNCTRTVRHWQIIDTNNHETKLKILRLFIFLDSQIPTRVSWKLSPYSETCTYSVHVRGFRNPLKPICKLLWGPLWVNKTRLKDLK